MNTGLYQCKPKVRESNVFIVNNINLFYFFESNIAFRLPLRRYDINFCFLLKL